jgi:hypothetical protein
MQDQLSAPDGREKRGRVQAQVHRRGTKVHSQETVERPFYPGFPFRLNDTSVCLFLVYSRSMPRLRHHFEAIVGT